MSDKSLKSEFEIFKSSLAATPPSSLSAQIYQSVESDLKLMPLRVFTKVSLIHLVSAVFTLSLCPQFGFRFFGEGMGLMHYFMSFGLYGCMMACGFFFMGVSLLIAAVILKPYELLTVRRHRLVGIGTIALLSLGFFIMVAAEQVVASFAIAWLFGSLAGAILVLELGWALRQKTIA